MTRAAEWNPTAEEMGNVIAPDTAPPADAGIVVVPADALPGVTPEDGAQLAADQALADQAAAQAEAEATAAQAEADAAAAKGWIPKGRFNEVLDKSKTMEAQIQALQQKLEELAAKPITPTATPATPDPATVLADQVDDLLIATNVALTDYGIDSAEYRASVKVYNQANRELMTLEASKQVTGLRNENSQALQTKAALDEVAEKNYELYPFLDKNSEAPNTEAIDMVIQIRNTYIQAGAAPADALQTAIDAIAPLYAKLTPAPASGDPAADQAKVASIVAAREKAAREKAAAASIAQPAFVVGRTDKGDFKLDIDKMSPAEVAALPKDVLDKLSGNVVSENAA